MIKHISPQQSLADEIRGKKRYPSYAVFITVNSLWIIHITLFSQSYDLILNFFQHIVYSV